MTFRFCAETHTYTDEAGVIPHITGLLERSGWIDDRWYTEEGSERGTAVHDLTAAYDLKALDVDKCASPYRGYLLGHIKAVSVERPEFLAVEEPLVHSHFRYGGRPDRVLVMQGGLKAIWEGKSGDPEKSHGIQTALQAILVAPTLYLPPEALGRFALYWKPNGRFRLEEHHRKQDFSEAYRILKEYC